MDSNSSRGHFESSPTGADNFEDVVFCDDVGGHAAAVPDVDALFRGLAADRGRVDAAAGAAAAGARLEAPPILRAWSMYVRSAVCSWSVCSAVLLIIQSRLRQQAYGAS